MTWYGLKHKTYGILGVEISSTNGEDFCNEVQYELSAYCDTPWLVKEKKLVEEILSIYYTIDWYNSSYKQPINPYDPKDLIIIEFEIKEKNKNVGGIEDD